MKFSFLCKVAMASVTLFALTSCGGGDGGVNDNDSPYIPDNAKGGNGNNGLTSKVHNVGITYAVLEGNIDISKMDARSQGLLTTKFGFTAGFEYGEDMYSLSEVGVTHSEGYYSETIQYLKPNTKYYYRLWAHGGDSYLDENSEIYATPGEFGTFTTESPYFKGSMSAEKNGEPTSNTVYVKCSFNTSTINKNETYIKGLAYSIDKSDLDASDLGKKLNRSTGYYGKEYFFSHYSKDPNSYANFVIIDDDMNLKLEVDPGTTIYYCPFIAFGDIAFTGQIKSDTSLGTTGSDDSGYVDLGLSCLWSYANIGVNSPYELGYSHMLDGTLAHNYFKSEERLPTRAEIQELNNKCKFKEENTGILITGPNGNSIFLTCYDEVGVHMGYPHFGACSSKGKYDLMYKFNNGSFKIEDYTSKFYSVYIRTVKDKNGGGDNPSGESTNYASMSLKDILIKPLGIVDMDLRTSSFSALLNVLNSLYKVEVEDWVVLKRITLRSQENPSCKFKYNGTTFYDFRIEDSNTETIKHRMCQYSFHLKKSEYEPAVALLVIDMIINDFTSIGYPIKLRNSYTWGKEYSYESGNSRCVLVYKDEDDYWDYIITIYYPLY